jgi:hypothetical protein
MDECETWRRSKAIFSGQLKAHVSSTKLTFEMWTDEGGQSARWFIENG